MAGKKQYYGLDEIGFVGIQGKRINKIKKDIEKTIQFIKATSSIKVIPLAKKSVRRLSKAKQI